MAVAAAALMLCPALAVAGQGAGTTSAAGDDITALVLIALALIVSQAMVILGLYARLQKLRRQVVAGQSPVPPPQPAGPGHVATGGDRAEDDAAALARVFDLTPEILCVMDLDGRLIRANAALAQMLGRYEAALLGASALQFLHPDDVEPTRQLLEAHRRGQAVHGLRSRIRTADGTYRLVEWYSAVDFEAGRIYTAGRDVTALQRTQRQLEALNRRLEARVAARTTELDAANRELESFAYSVSHDLRAPLRAIGGFAVALREDCKGVLNEPGCNHLERIILAAERMSGLIDALLGLSRVSRGPVQRRPIDLTETARQIIDDLRQQHPRRQVQVEIEDGMVATADPRLARIALENLLGNAWKFTAKRTVARIEVRRNAGEGKGVFEVRDNGAGFDMARAGKLFTPFQRLHSAEQFEGMGIGLATVRRIIHRHGGRLWARAEPDRGASIFFTLPSMDAGGDDDQAVEDGTAAPADRLGADPTEVQSRVVNAPPPKQDNGAAHDDR